MDDRELLRQFVDDRSEQAFADLVGRYVHLVYSSALRQVRDPGAAEDVAQSVFVLLAQKAKFVHAAALGGWLLAATRGVALNHLRAESRRRRRESEAAMLHQETQSSDESNWEQVKLVLDDAMSGLRPLDRDALALRYFQNQPMPQVALALGISQLAAQKRISRAVTRLRTIFARRGIQTSSEALSGMLLAHAVGTAPAHIASSIAASALTAAKAMGAAQTAKGVVTIMAMTKAKAAAGIAVAAMLVAGVTVPAVLYMTPRGEPAQAAPAAMQVPADQWSATGNWQPASQPSANGAGWKTQFQSVYGLAPDQNIKHVLPPFIGERVDIFSLTMKGANPSRRPGAQGPPPTSLMIIDDGTAVRVVSALMINQRTLASVLHEVIGIWPQNTDIPREKLAKDVPGDWVVRSGATVQQKIAGISEELLETGMTLVLQPVEREVIVVSGKFEYKPHPFINEAAAMPGVPQIIMFPAQARGEIDASEVAQSKDDFLQDIGEMFLRPVIIEADLGEARSVIMQSRQPRTAYLKSSEPPDDATINGVLNAIAEQTSLKFTRERRMVPTWRLVGHHHER